MKIKCQCALIAGLLVGSVIACWTGSVGRVFAQQEPELPQKSLYEAMLNVAKEKGWVQFRNFAGMQWVYFTPIQTLHCRIKEIRYSVNSRDLDKQFAVVKCNKRLPFSLPPGTQPKDLALQLAPGTAKTVAVQVIWSDGKQTEMLVYKPCDDVGEQVCAVPVK